MGFFKDIANNIDLCISHPFRTATGIVYGLLHPQIEPKQCTGTSLGNTEPQRQRFQKASERFSRLATLPPNVLGPEELNEAYETTQKHAAYHVGIRIGANVRIRRDNL